MRTLVAVIVSGMFFAGKQEAAAQTGGVIGFQGVLKDANGDLINGQVDLEFRLFTAEVGGNLVDLNGDGVIQDVIGQDAKRVVTNAFNGIVATAFGPVSPNAFDSTQRWLDMRVNGSAMPRIEMATGPAIAEQLSRGGKTVLTVHANRPGAVESLDQFLVTRDHAPGVSADQIVVRTQSDQDKQLLIGYDVEKNVGSLQAVQQNVAFRSIIINPKGGAVGIGTSPWPNGRLDVNGRVYADEVAFYRPDAGNYSITTETNALRINGYNTRFYNNGKHTLTLSLDGNAYFPGHVHSSVLHITGGSDLAEPFSVGDSEDSCDAIVPGMVVVIDPEKPGNLELASEPYDRRVAGIISGAKGLSPGMIMKAEGQPHVDGDYPVALTGRVWCWCDTSNGPIEPGDRVTTSATPGHAMKVTDRDRADGAVIGKAMTKLDTGTGLVLVLVQPQ